MNSPHKLLDEHLDYYSSNLTDDLEIDTQNLVDTIMSQYLLTNNINSNTDRMISFKINNTVPTDCEYDTKSDRNEINSEKVKLTTVEPTKINSVKINSVKINNMDSNIEHIKKDKLSASLNKLYSKKATPFAIVLYTILAIKIYFLIF